MAPAPLPVCRVVVEGYREWYTKEREVIETIEVIESIKEATVSEEAAIEALIEEKAVIPIEKIEVIEPIKEATVSEEATIEAVIPIEAAKPLIEAASAIEAAHCPAPADKAFD